MWIFSVAFYGHIFGRRCNSGLFWHTLTGWSNLWVLPCLTRVLFWAKPFPQTVHRNGRSPVCVRTWFSNINAVVNALLQNWHRNGEMPRWTTIVWHCKYANVVNLLLHSLHLYLLCFSASYFWFIQIFMCRLRARTRLKRLQHFLHVSESKKAKETRVLHYKKRNEIELTTWHQNICVNRSRWMEMKFETESLKCSLYHDATKSHCEKVTEETYD